MALRFFVKLGNALGVVHLLGVNFRIAYEDGLPDGFSGLFKVQVKVLVIFNGPEAVVNSNFLAQLA